MILDMIRTVQTKGYQQSSMVLEKNHKKTTFCFFGFASTKSPKLDGTELFIFLFFHSAKHFCGTNVLLFSLFALIGSQMHLGLE